MKLYSIDVRVYATAYIRAESEEEARAKADALRGAFVFTDGSDPGVEISGLQYDDPELPEVSLSPAMTIHGADEGVAVEEVSR